MAMIAFAGVGTQTSCAPKMAMVLNAADLDRSLPQPIEMLLLLLRPPPHQSRASHPVREQ